MGLLKAIGDILFGKSPDIFDENGRVRHKFSEKKWQQWDDRLKASPDYDWRQHVAKERIKNADLKVPAPAPVEKPKA
jgi:hypothetical protein